LAAIYITAWLALVAWAGANWLRAVGALWAARIAFTCGCAMLLAHVALAFHLVHNWDHHAAYLAVAAQTEERTGLDWGGGIYFNYTFAALWLVESVCWWLAPRQYVRRRRWLDATGQCVFLFMFVNATIVFGTPQARVAGAVLCPLGALGWICYARRRQRGVG